MAKKKLVVPSEGTQPANTMTPLDNMVNDIKRSSNSDETSKPSIADIIKIINKKDNHKRTCTFSIDKNVFSQFKAKCAANMSPMSSVLEKFMTEYLNQ